MTTVPPPTPTPVSSQQVPVGVNVNAATTGVGGGGLFPNASLYVGDLDHSVTESQLFEVFSQVAPVVSIRVCRDQTRTYSLGYGYVNYNNFQDATNALESLNFTRISGKPIRIMFSHRDPSVRKSGYANVFIKNLESSIDNKMLRDTFSQFGNVLSCKVAMDNKGQSKGYGFVQYDKEEAAQNAIMNLNNMLLNDKQVYVGLFVRKQDRDRAKGSPSAGLPTFTNVYVKNLSETVTDEDLVNFFGDDGKIGIVKAAVMKEDNGNGKSKGFGFVNFANPNDAVAAVEKFNGFTHNDKVWYVGRAQKKDDRVAELKSKFEQERNGEKLHGANLYLKNLEDSVTDEGLKELFSEFGTITSCKVMLDTQGQSRGSGFVAFSTPEEATKAVNEMNGKMIGRKPLYVAVAQRKEERRARLQAHFAQIRAPGVAPIPYGVPGFHPVGPRLGPQQLYFGQTSPTQPVGYGFQQPLMRPNYMMPYNLQRQGQRMGLRRGGTPLQIQQQQLMQRNANQAFRYMSSARNGLDPILPQGLMNPMASLPVNGSGVPFSPNDGQRTGSIKTLASALASASPDQQRQMLGEQLYPLVERVERDLASKITGMLLEMDQPEVLHLLEDLDALKKKVGEAMDVLQLNGTASDAAERLNSFSLD